MLVPEAAATHFMLLDVQFAPIEDTKLRQMASTTWSPVAETAVPTTGS